MSSPYRTDYYINRSRFSEEQVIALLMEQAAGGPVSELCWKQGVSDAILYKWKAKYGGTDVSESRRLKALEDENAKLKRMFTDGVPDNVTMKDRLGKNW